MDALETYKQSKKWAVVGVNTDPEKYGYKIYKRLKEKEKTVYGISVKNDNLDGDVLYKNLKELPEKVDVVVFVVNPTIGMCVLDEMKELGLHTAWLQPGTINEELLEKTKSYNIHPIEACVLVVSGY